MCYSALVKQDLKYLKSHFGAILVREQFEEYDLYSAADPKKYPKVAERIYPGSYAPVVYEKNGQRQIELMRYGTFPPASISNPQKYTSFNARRDNLLSNFWANAFMKNHGFIVLNGFFEWVSVSDLLKAGVVTLKQVEHEFKQQTEDRRKKIEAAKKNYKPTPTELKDPKDRKIIIQFYPNDDQDLLVPVIFSEQEKASDRLQKGFAIITDEPPLEVSSAGHDRCPIVLEESALTEWLRPDLVSAAQMQETLSLRARLRFGHSLPHVA